MIAVDASFFLLIRRVVSLMPPINLLLPSLYILIVITSIGEQVGGGLLTTNPSSNRTYGFPIYSSPLALPIAGKE
jgi:hypothetical protein